MKIKVNPKKVSSSTSINEETVFGGSSETIKEYHKGFCTIFKPKTGERKGMRECIRDLVPYYHREILAYELSELFSFNIVPMTVKAKVKGRVGSRQVWVDGETRYDFEGTISKKTQSQIARMILFDAVTGNTDRHSSNWIYDEPNKKLWAIDHGLCFPFGTMEESRIELSNNGKSYPCYDDKVSTALKRNDYSRIRKYIHKSLTKTDMKRLHKITKKEFLALFKNHRLGTEGKDAWFRLQTIIHPMTEEEKVA